MLRNGLIALALTLSMSTATIAASDSELLSDAVSRRSRPGVDAVLSVAPLPRVETTLRLRNRFGRELLGIRAAAGLNGSTVGVGLALPLGVPALRFAPDVSLVQSWAPSAITENLAADHRDVTVASHLVFDSGLRVLLDHTLAERWVGKGWHWRTSTVGEVGLRWRTSLTAPEDKWLWDYGLTEDGMVVPGFWFFTTGIERGHHSLAIGTGVESTDLLAATIRVPLFVRWDWLSGARWYVMRTALGVDLQNPTGVPQIILQLRRTWR
jgi:hypothetical protein